MALFSKIIGLVKQMTVEPIAVLVFLATTLYSTTQQVGIYQVICYQLYNDPRLNSNFTINCVDSQNLDIKKQNNIQQEISKWTIIMALSHFGTSMFSTCLLGAMGDVYGRKPNFLFGFAGILLTIVAAPVVFEFKYISLWLLVIMNIIGGCFGSTSLIMMSSYAYLCDRILDKRAGVSVRMTMFTALMTAAGILGSLTSGVLLKLVSVSRICMLIEILLVSAFFYTLFALESLTPAEMRQKILRKRQGESASSLLPDNSTGQEDSEVVAYSDTCQFAIRHIKGLFKDIVTTYTKARPSNERTFLLISSLILFFHMMADSGLMSTVLANYVLREPFYWTDGSQLGYWRATKGITTFIGNVGGILVFKKLFKMHDTTVMLISTVSSLFELILIAFSKESMMLYLAAVVGCFSNLIMPVIGSFISQIVHYGEIGKSFTVHGISAGLAFMVSATLCNSIYEATLDFMPGFVFLFGAGIMLICFFIILWVHIKVLVFNMQECVFTTDGNNNK